MTRRPITTAPVAVLLACCSSPGTPQIPARAVAEDGARVEVLETEWASAPALAQVLTDLVDASITAVRRRGCALPKPGCEGALASRTLRPTFSAAGERRLLVRLPVGTADELSGIRQLVQRLDVPLVDRVLTGEELPQ